MFLVIIAFTTAAWIDSLDGEMFNRGDVDPDVVPIGTEIVYEGRDHTYAITPEGDFYRIHDPNICTADYAHLSL